MRPCDTTLEWLIRVDLKRTWCFPLMVCSAVGFWPRSPSLGVRPDKLSLSDSMSVALAPVPQLCAASLHERLCFGK